MAWVGVAVAVLALGTGDERAPAVMAATSQAWAVLVALWVLARVLEEDRTSELRPAADALAPGLGGRLLGRWAGAVLAGALGATAIPILLGPVTGAWIDTPLYLLITNTWIAARVGAWGLLLATLARTGAAALAAMALWAAGHLPFGSPALLPGPGGSALAALLPGPLSLPPAPTDILRGAIVTIALLSLTVLRAAPARGPAANGPRPRQGG